ncbi:MAG: TIM barrel protein [Alphaproteobacteria bacterium]|nr:TIM barrel protein [Alphaproteobacteria bacterium]
MPRFSANLSLLFTEHAVLDRFAAARDAGFEAVEIQFPYDLPVEHWRRAKERSGLDFVLFNVPAGDLPKGGAGLAGVPGREGHFRAAVAEAKHYAEALAPRAVNVLAGWPSPTVDRDRCRESLVANLGYAADVMSSLGVRVVVEPINRVDRPDSLVATSHDGLEILATVGHANLALQWDAYHMAMMGEDPAASLPALADKIGHIQFADAPGRQEPGTGAIDFDALFTAIDSCAYEGWVGAEYVPSGATRDSLNWLRRRRARPA